MPSHSRPIHSMSCRPSRTPAARHPPLADARFAGCADASPPSAIQIVPSAATATPNGSAKRACAASPSRVLATPSPASTIALDSQLDSSGRGRVCVQRHQPNGTHRDEEKPGHPGQASPTLHVFLGVDTVHCVRLCGSVRCARTFSVAASRSSAGRRLQAALSALSAAGCCANGFSSALGP